MHKYLCAKEHKMVYKRPQASPITTDDFCDYGCLTTAKYIFTNGKKCCSKHQNSCQGKRQAFSKLDHTLRTKKSLETRIKHGITKTSQIKAGQTRVQNGHYKKLAKSMQEHWANNPWNNNTHCPIVYYKNTQVLYQGTYEYEFLEELEYINGLEWVISNVQRGPSLWYIDPLTSEKKLYISDFIIDNTIYEIKSSWTWNKNGKDLDLEKKNKAKLTECVNQGYNVVLILDFKRIEYARLMDGTL